MLLSIARIVTIVVLLVLAFPTAGRTAEADIYCQTGTGNLGQPIFQPASPTNPCPTGGGVSPSPLVVTPTDRSGSLTLGGTSQTLAAANASRKALLIQNPCTAAEQGIGTAENLYINDGAAAATQTNGNLANLAPCGSVTLDWNGHVDQTAITVNAATTGHKWNAKEAQ